MTEVAIDLVAASRVSKRVDLKEIRLIEIRATYQSGGGTNLRLMPIYDQMCVPTKVEGDIIEVSCAYTFKVRSAETELADASLTYLVVYKLIGDEPAEPADVEHFARANGAYHTWPFVRETIYGLTAKMGFPPYTLPVLSFLRPKGGAEASSESKSDSVSPPTPATTSTPAATPTK